MTPCGNVWQGIRHLAAGQFKSSQCPVYVSFLGILKLRSSIIIYYDIRSLTPLGRVVGFADLSLLANALGLPRKLPGPDTINVQPFSSSN